MNRVVGFLFNLIQTRLKEVFSIMDGTDVVGTIESIEKDIRIRGANAWILISAAILASIGLDTNSTAIIIGAMLISPLMASILGVGLGIGIMDRKMVTDSIKNMAVAVVLSLGASTLYFFFTPLGDVTSELVARTRPTLLDVGVAVFGGVAGIVANSRKNKTNAIPGVAIATALMPPLCTAGFGLAKGDMAYFLGAFYLFFINAFFIAFSTYIVIRILNFPKKEILDHDMNKKLRRWILAFSIIIVIPSAVIFFSVVAEANFTRTVNTFINDNINNEKRHAINWEIMDKDSLTYLKIYLAGEPLSYSQQDSLGKKLPNYQNTLISKYDITKLKLNLVQMNLPKEEREKMMSDVQLSLMKQFELKDKITNQKDLTIDSLQLEYDKIKIDTSLVKAIYEESAVFMPELESISFGLMTSAKSDTMLKNIPLAIVRFKEDTNTNRRWRRKIDYTPKMKSLQEFLQRRMPYDSVIVIRGE